MPTRSSKNPFSYSSMRPPMATPITHLGSFLPNLNEEQRQLVLQMNKVVEKIDFHHISGVLLIDLDQIFSLLFKYTSRVAPERRVAPSWSMLRESVDFSKRRNYSSDFRFTRNLTVFSDNIYVADKIIFDRLLFLLKRLFFVEKRILILCTQDTSFSKEDFFRFLHHDHALRSFFELFQRRVLISRSSELALNHFREFATTVLKTVVPISCLTFTMSPSKFRPDARDFRRPMPGPYVDRMRVAEEMSDDVLTHSPHTRLECALATKPPAPRKSAAIVPSLQPSTAVFGVPSLGFAKALRGGPPTIPSTPGVLAGAPTSGSLATGAIPGEFEVCDETLGTSPVHRIVLMLPVVHRGADGAVLCTSDVDPRDAKAVSEAVEAGGGTLVEMVSPLKSHSSSACSSPFTHGSRTPDKTIDDVFEVDVPSLEECQEVQRQVPFAPCPEPPPLPISSGFWGRFPWSSRTS